MTPRTVVIALSVLVALAISAVGPQGASAEGLGLYTCENTGSGPGFTSSTCETPSGSGPWQQVLANEKISRRWSSTGKVVLKTTYAGVKLTLAAAATASGIGTVENSVSGKETYTHGSDTLKLEEVAVTEPGGKGCKIAGGSITTRELSSTTLGQGMFMKVASASGPVLAEFTIEGCAITFLNGSYKLEGSADGLLVGASIVFTETEVTTQGTLAINTLATGMEGVLDFEGRKIGSGEEWTKLAAKTT
jgi:hypothetical protein